jgi:hypothetical protein
MSRVHDHDVVPGRKPGTERCKNCSWRFPCPDNDCAHSDCMEFRGELPRCHYCRERVQGSPAGFSSRPCPNLSLLEKDDPSGSWTRWSVRGHTRAVHYCCRDASSPPHDLMRWYGDDPVPPCTHGLDIGGERPQSQAAAG